LSVFEDLVFCPSTGKNTAYVIVLKNPAHAKICDAAPSGDDSPDDSTTIR
jgi:hypothetical protein